MPPAPPPQCEKFPLAAPPPHHPGCPCPRSGPRSPVPLTTLFSGFRGRVWLQVCAEFWQQGSVWGWEAGEPCHPSRACWAPPAPRWHRTRGRAGQAPSESLGLWSPGLLRSRAPASRSPCLPSFHSPLRPAQSRGAGGRVGCRQGPSVTPEVSVFVVGAWAVGQARPKCSSPGNTHWVGGNSEGGGHSRAWDREGPDAEVRGASPSPL